MDRREFIQSSIAAATATLGIDLHTPARTYRVAVIGRTGRGDYGHDVDTVWLDVPGVEIIAVADESSTGLAKAKGRLRAPTAYPDYREMLAREKPDIVSVAPRWLDCHRDMVVACAESGVKGVLLEKPVARDLIEADQMVAACERTGMKVAICHQTRYSPLAAHVKGLIGGGSIGDLLEIRCRGKEDSRGGGEDLMVLGTHLMDLMRHFSGDPHWCFARITEQGKPLVRSGVRQGAEGIGPLGGDTITATYGFRGPTVGHFGTHRVRHYPGARYGAHLYGTKGAISMGTGAMPPVFILEDPSWTLFQKGGKWAPVLALAAPPDVGGVARFGNWFIARDLIASIEENRQPLGSIYDGRAALEMIMAVYESHRANTPVDFPLRERSHPLSRL